MRSLNEIFRSPEYTAIKEYLKKADRWDLADKLLDLVDNSYNLGRDITLEIFQPILKIK